MTTNLSQPTEAAPYGFLVATPAVSNDGNIAAAAQKRFLASSQFDLRSLLCEQQGEVLLLHGRVSSYYHKQLAQEVVRNLAGPLSIFNAVEVVGT